MCPNEKFTFLTSFASKWTISRALFRIFCSNWSGCSTKENTLHRSHCFRLELNHRAMEQEKSKKCGRNNKRAAHDGFNNENKYQTGDGAQTEKSINQKEIVFGSVDVNGYFNVLGSTMTSTLTFRAFKFHHLIYILLILKGFFCPASDWVMRRVPTQCFARRPTHRWLTLIEIKTVHKLAIIFVRMTLEIIHQSISLWRFFWKIDWHRPTGCAKIGRLSCFANSSRGVRNRKCLHSYCFTRLPRTQISSFLHPQATKNRLRFNDQWSTFINSTARKNPRRSTLARSYFHVSCVISIRQQHISWLPLLLRGHMSSRALKSVLARETGGWDWFAKGDVIILEFVRRSLPRPDNDDGARKSWNSCELSMCVTSIN